MADQGPCRAFYTEVPGCELRTDVEVGRGADPQLQTPSTLARVVQCIGLAGGKACRTSSCGGTVTISRRRAGKCMAAIVSILGAIVCPVLPIASAQPCPDIGVAFARGTGEPPGLGNIGQAFVDALRAQAFPRTVGVYGVNYPASSNFSGGQEFMMNVFDGVQDQANHVRGVVSACPATRMVLSGYSQGAIVTTFVTSDFVPGGVPDEAIPAPMPAEIADNVAAVVLFGKPSGQSLVKYGVPTAGVGALYAGKSLELCAPGDNVCSGDPVVGPNMAHGAYVMNGMAAQGAAFGVSRL